MGRHYTAVSANIHALWSYGRAEKFGDGCAILGAQAILNISEFYEIGWKRTIDYTALAKLRWVDKLSMEAIAKELGIGRTSIVRHLARVRKDPELMNDESIQFLVRRRKGKFIGSS